MLLFAVCDENNSTVILPTHFLQISAHLKSDPDEAAL